MNLGSLADGADPSRTAFICLTDNRTYRYGDLRSLSDTVATDLASQFGSGEKIALLGVNSGAYMATLLGIMKAGLVAVPVNPKLPAVRIAEILEDAGVRLVFADDGLKDAVSPEYPVAAFVREGARAFKAVEPVERQPALILYTSGSTGRPKGVVLSHQAHVWTARTRFAQSPLTDEITLIAAPLFHMQALMLAFLVLASEGLAVLLPRFSIGDYLRAIENYRCSFITAVPPMIEAILRGDAIHETDLSSVKTVRLGSAPVAPGLFRKIAERFPGANVLIGYGTTESGPVTFGPHPDGLPAPAFSAGYPHPDVSLRLNEQDILEIRSPALMNGYHNRPELNPFTDDGYYITGDVFKKDRDGFYTFVGRVDDMFVSGGENIYPGEVETLLSSHAGVVASCVVPVADEIKGCKPVAFVIRKGAVSEEELKAHVLSLAAPHVHPRSIWFVESLPVTDTNKIDRKRLAAEAENRVKGKTYA